MKATTKSQLAGIEAYLNRNLASQAMDGLSDLLRSLPYEELSLARPDIEALIGALELKARFRSASAGDGQGKEQRDKPNLHDPVHDTQNKAPVESYSDQFPSSSI